MLWAPRGAGARPASGRGAQGCWRTVTEGAGPAAWPQKTEQAGCLMLVGAGHPGRGPPLGPPPACTWADRTCGVKS